MNLDIVPDKLGSPINYKVLVIIGILVIGFHIVVNILEDSDVLIYGFSMVIPASVSVLASLLQEDMLELWSIQEHTLC